MNKINFIEENFKVKRWYFDKSKFVLDEQQKMMLQHLEENNRVVITSSRCCGVTTVGAAFVALELASSTKDNPVKLGIFCTNSDLAKYFLKEVLY
jgi:superfamily II RNA helicase